MKRKFRLFNLGGLEVTARPLALISFLVLGSLLSLLGVTVLKQKPPKALAGGFLAATLHYAVSLWHHLGHARAANQSGYPMSSVDFWGPIGTSRYPVNEGAVPAEVHIQRALGGPIFSFVLTALLGLAVLALRPVGGTVSYLVMFTFADNLLVYVVGALMPLGFTDGSTLLEWWDQRQSGSRISLNGG